MEKNWMTYLFGKWNTQTVVAIAIGAALFGVLMIYGSITVFTNTRLTTSMIVPVVVGALYGALPAAIALFFGNMFADLLAGWGFWIDWSIGNFFLGLFVGLLPLYGARVKDGIFKPLHAVIFGVIAAVGNALAFGVLTPIFTVLLYGGELTITFMQAFAAFASNSIVLIAAGIPVLFALAASYRRSSGLRKE